MGQIDIYPIETNSAGVATTTPTALETQQPGASGSLRQVMAIGDPTTRANILTIGANGQILIQGYQPAATTYSGITTAVAQASLAVSNLNIATVTLRTFTGTTPSITWKLQASDDGGTTWVDVQGINNSNGIIGVSWTQAAALAAGTGGPSIDYAIGAYTHIRINVTAISGASATAAFGIGVQSMPYEPSPGVVAQGAAVAGAALAGNPVRIGGSDGTNILDFSVVAKGTQGAKGLATQDLKDSGRVNIMWTAELAASAVAEALLTLTESRDGAATSTFTTKVVTTGKRLRITSISMAVESGGSTGTAIQRAILRMRFNTAGAVTTASPLQAVFEIATAAALKDTKSIFMDFPDGIEFLGDGTKQIGFTLTNPDWVVTTSIPTTRVTIFGYEY